MLRSIHVKHGLMAMMAALFLLNVLSIAHLNLSEDGAHYSLYGVFLNWGYVDHPPLIGWVQAALLFLFGHHDVVMHLSAFVFSFGMLCVVFHLSRALFPHQSDVFPYAASAALFLSSVFLVLTMLVLTQNPLIFFCLLTCWFVWRLLETHKKHYFIFAGLSLGCAGLSDYTAFLFAMGLGLYVLLFARFLFKCVWLYVALAMTALMVSPFILWNYHHHFISFVAGAHRVASHGWEWKSFFSSLLMQSVAYSPALVLFSIMGAVSAVACKDRRQLLLVIPAMLILLFFGFSGGVQRIDFHWPALGWMLLAPIAVNYMCVHWHSLSVKIITAGSAMLTAVVCGLFYFQVLVFPIIIIGGRSPLYELHGWRQAAQHATALAHQFALPGQSPVLFVDFWAMASRLAWYSRLPVQMVPASPIPAYFQFARWYGQPHQQANGVMVTSRYWHHPRATSKAKGTFSHCNYIDSLPIVIDHRPITAYDFYHCWGYNT